MGLTGLFRKLWSKLCVFHGNKFSSLKYLSLNEILHTEILFRLLRICMCYYPFCSLNVEYLVISDFFFKGSTLKYAEILPKKWMVFNGKNVNANLVLCTKLSFWNV